VLKLPKIKFFLLDSGGQYRDGTTDVTRTVHYGQPTPQEKKCFTLVLKGHIALATAVFPEGTTGGKLDTLARLPLWNYGLDYRHGTGHGVGAFLNVHEGPQGVGFRPAAFRVDLSPGMTVTDEPGYYEEGAFGIRIESVLIVQNAKTEHNFGGTKFYTFENITMAPIQTKLVDVTLLHDGELAWLNAYNHTVQSKLCTLVDEPTKAWLQKECAPLKR